MKLLLFCFLLIIENLTESKIVIEKLDSQVDPKYVKVDHNIRHEDGQSLLDINAQLFTDSDDVNVNIGAFSKIDGKYNEFLKPDPVSACTIKDSKDPLIIFVFNEFEKFGNLTNACPPKKGYYYAHNFRINDDDLPTALPSGEYRIDLNATVQENGKPHKIYSLELYFANK